MSTFKEKVRISDPALSQHLSFLQNIIARMANCSLLFKTITITITGGLIALIYQNNNSFFIMITAIFIIAILSIIDALYLNLEQSFRKEYERIILDVHANKMDTTELFIIKKVRVPFFDSYKSWSILFYYLALIAVVFIVYERKLIICF